MTTNGATPEPDDVFRELSKIVLGEQPLSEILEQVVHLANRTLRTVTEASITLLAGDDPTTIAFSGELALALDERQYEAERGPCLDAAASGERIIISDMASDTRWPRFSSSATERGIRSSLSIPLPVQRQVTGALNFYAGQPDAFDEQTIELAETFAAHAAVALANAHLYETTSTLAEQMRQAMATRAVIEQAKGIIMRDKRCTGAEAFNYLIQLSQTSHRKLRDIAQALVDNVVAAPPPDPDPS